MSEERIVRTLDGVTASLSRIESQLTASATAFTAHAAEDRLVAEEVRRLARRQSGFIGGIAAAGLAIGAGIAAALKWLLGRHGG